MQTMAKTQQQSRIVESCFLLLAFPPLFAVGAAFDNYALIYAFLVGFLCMATALVSNYLRVTLLSLTLYLSIGLLNISTWRGYTTVETISLYAWSMYFLVAPILMLARRQIYVPFQVANQQNLLKLLIVGHLAIVYLALLYVFASIGNVLSAQSLRFDIPPALEYVIKSALPAVAVLPFLRLRWSFLWLMALLLPPMMIGSRGAVVIGIIAYLIVLVHRNGGKFDLHTFLMKNRTYLLYALSGIVIISVMFYMRRSGDTGFSPVDVIIHNYFDYDNFLVRAIMPLYLGFKETIGLSTAIITEQVENTINPYPLFFADLFTLMPGENLAAGQSMARIFGATQDGGLTPGLLGGIYIDFGLASLVGFGAIGLLLSWMQRSVAKSPYFVIIYAQVLVQSIHLFHRGFIKPEYVTSVLIACFYAMLCHRSRAHTR